MINVDRDEGVRLVTDYPRGAKEVRPSGRVAWSPPPLRQAPGELESPVFVANDIEGEALLSLNGLIESGGDPTEVFVQVGALSVLVAGLGAIVTTLEERINEVLDNADAFIAAVYEGSAGE